MFLKRLELVNFRNYKHSFVEFPTNKTILVGKNAQGKSNLLEAVYYLATLSSNRTSSDGELILWGEVSAKVKAIVEKSFSEVKLDVQINQQGRNVLKVNDIKKNNYSGYLGNLIIVNFGVSDLLLLRGSPSDRRKWIDISISQLYPAYSERLSKYNKIRIQRNNLLKDFKGNINLSKQQEDSLSVWDEQIVITGSNLIHLRQKYLKEIQPVADIKHKYISIGEENLLIKYSSTVTGEFNSQGDEVMSPEKIAEIYRDVIISKRKEELIRAQTVVGPHRDDILFFINNINAETYASQGQQRTVILSLKLAELDFVRNVTGENPVLLLDDVLAELDQTRQNFLLDSIKEDTQTIITTTDISNFEPVYLQGVTIYNVKQGEILNIG
jgi:DNA replication and repair protein RecF